MKNVEERLELENVVEQHAILKAGAVMLCLLGSLLTILLYSGVLIW